MFGRFVTTDVEPNRRQQYAVDRVEYAVDGTAPVMLSGCNSRDATGAAIADVLAAD